MQVAMFTDARSINSTRITPATDTDASVCLNVDGRDCDWLAIHFDSLYQLIAFSAKLQVLIEAEMKRLSVTDISEVLERR